MADRDDHAPGAKSTCANCCAPLTGPYCAECGQPRTSPIMSAGALLGDFLRLPFSMDSRARRTLSTLTRRPGVMTRDFIAGKRYTYTPPVRLYLLTSLAFLLVATNLVFSDASGPRLITTIDAGETGAGERTPGLPPQSALELDRMIDRAVRDGRTENVRHWIDQYAQVVQGRAQQGPGELDDGSAVCDRILVSVAVDWAPADEWLREGAKRRKSIVQWLMDRFGGEGVVRQRAETACQRLLASGGPQAFSRELVDRLPTSLLVILPPMALALTLLYPLSGRRYVEHLLVIGHFHAFIFVIWGTTLAVARLLGLLPGTVWLSGSLVLLVSAYTPWYLYRALRVVYDQGRPATALKCAALSSAYLVALSFAVVLGVLLAAESFTR